MLKVEFVRDWILQRANGYGWIEMVHSVNPEMWSIGKEDGLGVYDNSISKHMHARAVTSGIMLKYNGDALGWSAPAFVEMRHCQCLVYSRNPRPWKMGRQMRIDREWDGDSPSAANELDRMSETSAQVSLKIWGKGISTSTLQGRRY